MYFYLVVFIALGQLSLITEPPPWTTWTRVVDQSEQGLVSFLTRTSQVLMLPSFFLSPTQSTLSHYTVLSSPIQSYPVPLSLNLSKAVLSVLTLVLSVSIQSYYVNFSLIQSF